MEVGRNALSSAGVPDGGVSKRYTKMVNQIAISWIIVDSARGRLVHVSAAGFRLPRVAPARNVLAMIGIRET